MDSITPSALKALGFERTWDHWGMQHPTLPILVRCVDGSVEVLVQSSVASDDYYARPLPGVRNMADLVDLMRFCRPIHQPDEGGGAPLVS